ncbi:MAG: hypothetical protein ISR78_02720 [Spirochaetia bacterium]|nr:hypothetical protein [Spirochaetia bacterium]
MGAKTVSKIIFYSLSIILIFFGLYFSSLYNFLLFHSIAEIFSIVVAYAIFMFAWNSRQFMDNNYLFFLGIAYFFIGCIDLLHTLAYSGMNIFATDGANLATQLWISARYLQSISLLLAPLFLKRDLKAVPIIISYLLITILLISALFIWQIFPDCYVENSGLTVFKKISEYLISLILICSIIFLTIKREAFDQDIFKLLIASIIFTIGSELFFTFYVSVFGLSNLLGHFLKIIAFYLFYKAIIKTGLLKPYDLLFRNLRKSEQILQKEKENLQKALSEIKTLKGIVPICANCKKIRDDDGYWNQLEEYIRDHSEVDFSHGICPDCAEKLYSELDNMKNK